MTGRDLGLGRAALGVVAALTLALFCRPDAGVVAQAYTELSPATIDLRNGGTEAYVDCVRYEWVSVAGPTGGYVVAPGHGPQQGFIGEIDYLTGGGWIGALLDDNGIRECDELPTTGALSGTLDEDGEAVPIDIAFAPGEVRVPALYGGAGETYARRMVVADEGLDVLVVEVTCPTPTTPTGVYVHWLGNAENARPREVYFWKDEAAGVTKLEAHASTMEVADRPEHYAVRFEFADGIARLWKVRTVENTDESSGVAAVIDTAEGIARVNWLPASRSHEDTSTFTSDEASPRCFDLNTSSDSTECEPLGLAIEDPEDTIPVDGNRFPFTYRGITSLWLPMAP